MNTNHKILLSAVMIFAFSIPPAHSQTFDGDTCMSFLSAQQVKDATGFEGEINARIINGDLTVLNEYVSSGCVIGFENEDRSFVIALSIAASSPDDADRKFNDTLAQIDSMGFDSETGTVNNWDYNLVEINQAGLGSAYVSVKEEILMGFNAPTADYQIDSTALLELAKIIHEKIDSQEFTNEDKTQNINSNTTSPLKQIANGISSTDVVCHDGMKLVFKNTNNNPACVNPTTAEKLVERGWANL